MDTKQYNNVLAKMPGPFKSKLERIRRYLYLGKASVMVGAGFSRNADVPSHIKVKQWNDVGKDIYCRLRSVEEAAPADLVFKTPMRLASQFAAVYGRSELDNLIRDAIPDDKMNPGALHHQLLDLPWRDVFTTNYDTLLEKARKGLHRNYSVVTSKEMLLYKKSPRIIKLHGSFPDKTPFLMTEEDFMTYPVQHPEFVNTVRQALVESIFCLVGFSGDDPNFTSWQAWLQDVMGDYAGPSYLITCDKDYDDAFRSLMKQRGIDVINFSEIEGLNDYKAVLDFFFTYLSGKESEWSGSVSYDSRNIDIKGLTTQLRSVRVSYPGWFVLPKKYYRDFTDMIYQFPFLDKKIKELDVAVDKEAILFELDWRADISLTFKDFDWYREMLEEVVGSYGDNPLSDNALTLAISLLRLYRHHLDKQEGANTLKEKLMGQKTRMSRYQFDRFCYTVAGNALSLMDYDSVDAILKIWNPAPSQYNGVIYKAMVLAECKDRSESIALLSEAFDKITLSLAQASTEEEKSLRSAIENLLAFYAGERMPDNDSRYSFLELSDFFQRQIGEANKERFEITHGFGIGSASRSWNSGSGTNKELLNPYRYLLLCEAYGFPYGMETHTVDEKILESVLPLLTGFGLGYSIGPVIRSGSRKVAVSYANRKALNTLSRKQADAYATLLLEKNSQDSCEKARRFRASNVMLPLLSRLSSSCSVDVVVAIFKYVHKIYRTTYMAKREDMQIIYSNLMPEGIQEVCDEVYNSEIFSDERELDVPLPQLGLNNYTPGDKAIDVVCDDLHSTEKKVRESAYIRIEHLLESNISVEHKEEVFKAIREWRIKEPINLLTRDSYRIVPPTKEEEPVLKEQLKKDVEKFVNGNYAFDGSSIIISTLDVDFRNLTVEAALLKKEQITVVLNKIAGVLEANFDNYSKDDSEEMMGGLRNFTVPVFRLIGEFVRLATNAGFDNKNVCAKLFNVLIKYLPSNLPVRITLERLNYVAQVIGANRIRDIVIKDIISDNERVVVDSCNGLVSYVHHYANYQKALQNIIFYCTHAVAEHMHLYLQTLSMIPIDKMSKATQEQLAVMLEAILERMPNQNILEEQKVDVMHDGVVLAASLKETKAPKSLVAVLKKWETYANSEEIYNDIRLPWFL